MDNFKVVGVYNSEERVNCVYASNADETLIKVLQIYFTVKADEVFMCEDKLLFINDYNSAVLMCC